MHKNESNASMVSRFIFYLKSVNFLFLSVYNGIKHTIIPIASSKMIKAPAIMTFAYHITVCIRDIIPTASNMLFKARVTMNFSCDKKIFIHNNLSTASNIMIYAQGITKS